MHTKVFDDPMTNSGLSVPAQVCITQHITHPFDDGFNAIVENTTG